MNATTITTRQSTNTLSKGQRRRRNRKARQTGQSQQGRVQSSTTIITNGNPTNTSGSRRRRRRNRGGGITQSNPYLAALLHPEAYPGVKIPDITSFPSATVQMSSFGTAPTGAGGDSVVIAAVPCFNDISVICKNGTTIGNIATTSHSVTWPGLSVAAAAFDYYRPVSAALEVEFVGPTTADGGYWFAWQDPRDTILPTTALTALTTAINSEIESFSSRKVRVTWKPMDNKDFEYKQIADATQDSRANFGALNVIGTGLPSAVSYLLWRFTVNFEVIPHAEAVDIAQPTPSPANLSMFQNTLNVLNRIPDINFGKVQPTLNALVGAARLGQNLYQGFSRVQSLYNGNTRLGLGTSAAQIGW